MSLRSGVPGAPDWRRGLFLEDHGPDDAPIFASMSQPAYAKYWWPTKDRPDDKIERLVLRYTVRDGVNIARYALKLIGDGQDDDIYGNAGWDWISGGTGRDGVIGDDGRIFTSRNSDRTTIVA